MRMCKLQVCLLAMILVAPGACSKKASKDLPREKYVLSSMTRPVPDNNVPYGPSHALTPRAELQRWLNKHSERGGQLLPIKLPVVVTLGDLGGFKQAFVGTSMDDPGHDKLHLSIDDGPLGIPITERIRSRCGKKVKRCVLWLEGYWGATVPIPGTPPNSALPPSKPQAFSARRAGKLIQPGTAARASIAK